MAREPRVEVDFVRPGMNDVAPVPAGMMPVLERAPVKHARMVISLLNDCELVGCDAHTRKVEGLLERLDITRVEGRHEFIEALHRRGDLGLMAFRLFAHGPVSFSDRRG